MGAHRLAIRIVGVAPTSRGFGFAVAEGADRLIDWGSREARSRTALLAHLDALVDNSRPLFVACEIARHSTRAGRARMFTDALLSVCRDRDIMVLCIARVRADEGRSREPTNHDLVQAAADRFSVIARKVPRRRRVWEGPDERVGVFLAAAAAAAGWDHFRPRA